VLGTGKMFSCRGAYASYAGTTYGRRCAANPSECYFIDRGSCSTVCTSRTTDGGWYNCSGSDGVTYDVAVTAYVK
jgi:hypothetical protein